MSQSPQQAANDSSSADLQKYRDSWSALSHLIGQGKSFSGNERNCFYLNTQDGKFTESSSAFGADLGDDSRAIAVTDWNFDGAPDLWLSNRNGPRVKLLLNPSARQNNWLRLRLQGTQSNRDAIGARVTVFFKNSDQKRIRTVRAGDGFLSQSSKWLHFGLGEGQVDHLEIRWPNGAVESVSSVAANTHYQIKEGTSKAIAWTPPTVQLDVAAVPEIAAAAPATRTWIMGRVPFIEDKYRGKDATVSTDALLGRPVLINLWSKDCQPCWRELDEWAAARTRFEELNCQVLALSVDALAGEATKSLASIKWPFAEGQATAEFVDGLELIQRASIEWQQPLPVPSSFLLDKHGMLAAIYKGTHSADEILRDVRLLEATPEQQRAAAVPFPGTWASEVFPSDPAPITKMLDIANKSDEAIAYLVRYAQFASDPDCRLRSQRSLAYRLIEAKRFSEFGPVSEWLRQRAPQATRLHRDIANRLLRTSRPSDALPHFELVLAVEPNDAVLTYNAGLAALGCRDFERAKTLFRKSLGIEPADATVHYQLANVCLSLKETSAAVEHYRQAHQLKRSWALPANNLAWLLSTSKQNDIRDGAEAVKVIEPFCRNWNGRESSINPSLLSTYAAALAEVGDFDKARKVNGVAIKSFQKLRRVEEVKRLTDRDVQFQQGQPVRD